MRKLLMGVEACCRDTSPARRSFDWKENGRSFRLECRVNDAERENQGVGLEIDTGDKVGEEHRG